MKDDHFEGAFSDYLDSIQYDQAETALFAMLRQAFYAGWQASERAKRPILLK